MENRQRRTILETGLESLISLAALTLATWIGYRLHAHAVLAAVFYICLVVLISLRGSLIPALLVAVVGTVVWDWVFTSPLVTPPERAWRGVMMLAAFTGIAIVITRLVRTLRTSEARWKMAFENNPTMYFMIDPAGTVLSVNPFGAEQLGYAVADLVGQPVLNVFVEEDKAAARDHLERCIARVGETLSWELRKVRKDGSILSVRETARAVKLAPGRPVVLIACEDITERKTAQDGLRESEARLRAQANLLDLTHDRIFVRDEADVIVYWNRGAEEGYGWSETEALGKVSHELMKTKFPEPLSEINATLLRTGRWEGELSHAKRDGTRTVVASRWSLQRDAEGKATGVLETNNDITERKRAEEESRAYLRDLRESSRRYQNIFQTAAVSIWEEDFSQVKAAIDDLRAQGVSDFRRYFSEHGEFVERAIKMVRILDVNDATLTMFGAGTKEELLGSLHKIFTPATRDVFVEELLAVAEGRTDFSAAAPMQTIGGDRLDVLLTIAFPSESSKLDSVLVSIMDITARRRAEDALQRAHAELSRVGALTTMGELAASIAHELRQPLAAIVMNGSAALRWLNRESPDLGQARDAASRTVREAQRADEVIRGLRALLGKKGLHRRSMDINDAIHEVLELVRAELRRNDVVVHTDLSPTLRPVFGDRVQLQQVLLNLILNGVEAMSSVAGRPRVLVLRTESAGPDEVAITVDDTGPGLDPTNAAHIFETFFTTKADGLGMGLSICRSIVQAHGGLLSASPRAPHGATFRFTVTTAAPASDVEALHAKTSSANPILSDTTPATR